MIVMPSKPKITQNRRSAKLRSSPEARRLIRLYVRYYGSQRAAAARLHMTQAALSGILSGRLRDTAAMQAALARADERARRAWGRIDQHEPPTCINEVATLRAALRALEQAQIMIVAILRGKP